MYPINWNDTDNDGTLNDVDLFPYDPTETSDFDNDGIGDVADPDDDNDGVNDDLDAFPYDSMEDTDRDGDGVPNTEDAFPDNPNEWSDLDGDGIGDNADLDIDGDGVGNSLDYYPYNASAWSLPVETPPDMDLDGIPDSEDLDLDGDGWNNDVEMLCGSDPQDATSVPQDTDDDGTPDALDPDIDGDNVGNTMDAYPLDPTSYQFPEEEEGIGMDMILLIFVLVISLISLAVSITGKRHGADSPETKGNIPGEDTFSHTVNDDDIRMGTIKFRTSDGKDIEITLPEPVEGDIISGTVTKPGGVKDVQKTKNRNVQSGYVVDMEKKPEDPKKKKPEKKEDKAKNSGILDGAAMDAESSEELSIQLQLNTKEMQSNIDNLNKVDEEPRSDNRLKDPNDESGFNWANESNADDSLEIKEPDKNKNKKKDELEGTISYAEPQTPYDRLG